MSDHVDRAADLLWEAIDDEGIEGRLYRQDCHYITATLDAAGLLATPEHDAAVAARALRNAADALDGGIGTSTARFSMDPHDYDSRADYGYAVAEADLRDRADRIEREGGAP